MESKAGHGCLTILCRRYYHLFGRLLYLENARHRGLRVSLDLAPRSQEDSGKVRFGLREGEASEEQPGNKQFHHASREEPWN
jgi:hypothetical protein